MDSGKVVEFPHFDVVQAPKDHHFLPHNTSSAVQQHFNNNGNSSVWAMIMKEWKILKNNLPDSIYVQVYETRIDLLRAVIIGPSGTPYHDGLFFFDICLPFNYPKQPPKVYYRSHGYRLNPNLYANGKVCLSLINTWQGSTAEKWTQSSTLLQLLVSIQGLVLNEKPVFNEPGLGVGKNSKLSLWLHASMVYNQDAFILSCNTMLQIMNKPPENFEDFVAHHFHARADVILAAIRDYLDGRVMVGQFGTDGACWSSRTIKVSKKFKANLRKIHSSLSVAFFKIDPKRKIVELEPEKIVKKNKKGVFSKFVSFAKKIWK